MMLKNGLYNAAIAISGPLINLITIPIATKALGPHAFGEASVTLSIVSYFLIITTLGLVIYGTRELAQTKGDKEQTAQVFSELLVLSFLASLVGTAVYVCSSLLLLPINYDLILIGSLTVALNFLNVEWLFYANENYKTIAFRTLFARTLSLLAILILVKSPDDFLFFVAATLLSNIIPSLLVFSQFKKYASFGLRNINLKRHFKSIGSFLGIRIFSSVYSTLDIAIVGLVASSSTAGFYAIAIRVARIVTSLVCSATAVVMPKVAALRTVDDKEEYHQLLVDTLIVTVFLSVSAFACILLLSHSLVEFLGGGRYAPAQTALAFLSFLCPVVALSNFIGMQILYPEKKENAVAISLALGSVVCIITMPIFLYVHGLHGGAASVILAELSILAVQVWLARNHIFDIYHSQRSRVNKFMIVSSMFFICCMVCYFGFDVSRLLVSLVVLVGVFLFYFFGLKAAREPMLLRCLPRN